LIEEYFYSEERIIVKVFENDYSDAIFPNCQGVIFFKSS